jgi:hypothetical protein
MKRIPIDELPEIEYAGPAEMIANSLKAWEIRKTTPKYRAKRRASLEKQIPELEAKLIAMRAELEKLVRG